MQRETACFTAFPVGRRHPPDSPAVHLRRIGKHHVASNLVVLNGLMIRLSYHPWSMPLFINHAHGKLPTVEVSPGVAASRDMWMGGAHASTQAVSTSTSTRDTDGEGVCIDIRRTSGGRCAPAARRSLLRERKRVGRATSASCGDGRTAMEQVSVARSLHLRGSGVRTSRTG